MGRAKRVHIVAPPLKLDLGCGPRKQDGFHGVDVRAIDGVDTVLDLRQTPWPWADGSVAEVVSSHFVEHLTGVERVPFFNELYRVLKIGGTAAIIVPHWSNACAYGDPTHQWPPMSEWASLYLNKAWREGDGTNPGNAPHVRYTCDFDFVNGFSFDEKVVSWNPERKMFALAHHLNSARDLHMNLTKAR
jgi:predicted SAM-dependent methyltransferase